jgi:hypothetical protein
MKNAFTPIFVVAISECHCKAQIHNLLNSSRSILIGASVE